MAGLIDFNALRPNAAMEAYQQGQQNQLAQMQLAQQQQAIQDAEAERQAWKGASGYNEVQQRLMAQGLGKQALAVGAAQAKAQADKVAMLKGTTELMKNTATQIMANPESAIELVTRFGQQTGHDVTPELRQFQAAGGDLDKIKQIAAGYAVSADKLLPHFETRDLGGVVQRQGYSPLTGAAIGEATTYKKTATPGELLTNARENERIGLEKQRVELAQNEAKLKREGIEGISPKDLQKREAAFPAATQSIKGFEAKSDSFIRDLKALRDHPGLEGITGAVYGRTPSIGKESSAAQALYDKVVAKGGFQALQDLRDASKTGGALGNVSNQEGKQLSASFAAIQRTQSAEDVRAAIDQAIADIEGAKTRTREAYDATYSYKRPAAPAGGAGGVDTTNPLLK
jgi:hypothetical protein